MEKSDDLASLSGRVARGATWIAAARLAANVFGFISMIVVARLLAPEDFGLVAVAVSAMQLLNVISDIGVSQAVVRFRDAGRDDLDTLFTISAARGAIFAKARKIKEVGMARALQMVGLPLDGSHHRGLDDARRTGGGSGIRSASMTN